MYAECQVRWLACIQVASQMLMRDEGESAVKRAPFFLYSLLAASCMMQAADTVILYDTDWNPQQDLQAQVGAWSTEPLCVCVCV